MLHTQGLKVTFYKALPSAFLPIILMSLFKVKCPFADGSTESEEPKGQLSQEQSGESPVMPLVPWH